MDERNLSGKSISCKRVLRRPQEKPFTTGDTEEHGVNHNRPAVGRISRVSTVEFGGSRIALTTAAAMVAGDIIFFRGACGQKLFQISVLVAPGMRAITRIPFPRSSSRRVLVRPSAPCLEAM